MRELPDIAVERGLPVQRLVYVVPPILNLAQQSPVVCFVELGFRRWSNVGRRLSVRGFARPRALTTFRA